MRIPNYGRGLLALVGVSLAGLMLIACSTQVPLSATASDPGLIQQDSPAAQQPAAPVADQTAAAPLAAIVEQEKAQETVELPANETVVTDANATNPSQAAQVNSANAQAGITTSGLGRSSAAPDLATLNLGVEAFASTVSEARQEAASAMTDVLAALRAAGVEEKDIQTGRFNINPRYTRREVTRCTEGSGDSSGTESGSIGPATQDCYQEYQSVITGYEVNNHVAALVRDLDSVDDVIDGTVDAGGDLIRFNGITFGLEDMSQLQIQARAAAVADLNDRASQLAELSQVTLGDLVYLAEVSRASPRQFNAEFALLGQAAYAQGAASTPISGGEVAVTVSVEGTFDIGAASSSN